MANSALESLPEISILDEEGITLESLQSEMVEDFENYYKEKTGKEITLHKADERRIELMVVAGMLYQMCVIMDERYKMNFLPYMYGDILKNWASNFGFTGSGIKSAVVKLRFYVSSTQNFAVGVSQGTRVTAGDNVYFATDEYVEIEPGEECAEVMATCTTEGSVGNEYKIGQINTIADPINLVSKVENITISDGGRDEYTDDELRELILNFPSTYSTAGPEDAYIQIIKGYSDRIVSVRKVDSDDAVVRMCIMCSDGWVPDEAYCMQVLEYVKSLKNTPDTDKVEIVAPEVVQYELDATFYISESRKDVAESIRAGVEDAAQSFAKYTQENIGHDINTDILRAYVNAAGARRLVIESPGYRTISENQIAICKSVNVRYGGLEEE